MDSFTVLAKVLEQALIAWNYGQKYSFIKKLSKIRMKYEVEFEKPSWSDREDYPQSKPNDFKDFRVLHDFERQLRVLGQEYLARKSKESGV